MAALGAEALPVASLESVRALSGLFREAQPRETAKECVFQDVLEILTSTSSTIEQTCKDSCGLADLDNCLLLIAECFRCLRNACVECAKNQHVIRNLGVISTSVSLIKLLHGIQIKEELLLTALRCSLQFLGNVAAGNGDSQNSIWKCAFPDLFLTCLTYSDERIVAYCCMVLFTCLNSERVRELLDPGNLTVTLHVLRVYKEQLESEWSFLIVTEHLLKCPELVKTLYAKLSNQERVTLLELMMMKLSDKNSVTSEEMNVFLRHADFLAVCFQENCGAVLKLTAATHAEDEEALVTIRLLDLLCEITSNNGQLEHLQAFPGLLETAVDTLRLTHLAGKEAVNIFTATHAVTGQEEISHPAVGFKSHLIRLIGNLCYKNKENQDKVYDLDGISLILDNCGIDDNNPSSIIVVHELAKAGGNQVAMVYNNGSLFLQDANLQRCGCESVLQYLISTQLSPLRNMKFKRTTACLMYDQFVNTVTIPLCFIASHLNVCVVSQWAVYAIRNLTEQNKRNQALIAQMEQKGLADSSALKRMGLEIQQQDDKLILQSVRKKPS